MSFSTLNELKQKILLVSVKKSILEVAEICESFLSFWRKPRFGAGALPGSDDH